MSDKSFPFGGRTPMVSFEELHQMIRYIEGRLLTITDATQSDAKQREAVKSLVKMSLNEVREIVKYRFNYLSEHSSDQGSLEPWDFSPNSSL